MTKDFEFKLKSYLHILPPLPVSWKSGGLYDYCSNPQKIKSHKFSPLVHIPIIKRKFRPREKDRPKAKEREIRYASHLDSCIYQYYASKLGFNYEVQLKLNDLDKEVIAYRKVPIKKNGPGKSTLHHVKDILDFVRQNQKDELVVMALDISGFFDNLDHNLLKKIWCDALGKDKLPEDHYNVFRSLTRFSYADIGDLFKYRTRYPYVKCLATLNKKKNASFFNSMSDFRREIVRKGLLYLNKEKDDKGNYHWKKGGIPQGTPISPLLANMYMLDFDIQVKELVAQDGGLYRRYSDDLLVVTTKDRYQEIEQQMMNCIQEVGLEIQKRKTQVFLLNRGSNGDWRLKMRDENDAFTLDRNLQYLGLEFDGKIVRLKNSSLSQYYRKMKIGVKRASVLSIQMNATNHGTIYKSGLYNRYSHIGRKTGYKLIRENNLKNKNYGKYKRSNYRKWGNFHSYVYRASNIFDEKDSVAIKRQVRNHGKILHSYIAKNQSKQNNQPIL